MCKNHTLQSLYSIYSQRVKVILNVCILVLLGLKCTRSLNMHNRHTRATFLLINHAHVIQWNEFETN